MTETPFYFPNGGYSLFGIFHQPDGPSDRPVFVFCHPFGEEKLWTHRVFVSFARRLASEGHAVLRFDLMGNGDSDGDFSNSSLASAASDVRCAIAQARLLTGSRRVSLLGLRFGATIAALAAEQERDIHQVLLWAPIVDGARYMQELLRVNVTTQMAVYKEVRHDREALVEAMRQGDTVNVDGYDLGFALYSEVSAVKLAVDVKKHPGPVLIAQIERQVGVPAAELQQLATRYEHATLKAVQEEAFWKEIARSYQQPPPNLFPATLEWLHAAGQ